MQSLLFPRLSFSRLIHSRSVFPHRVISSRFSHSASELPNRFFSTATPEPTQDVEGDKINEQFLKKMERRYKIRVKPGSDYESRLKVVKSLYEKDETIEATDETAEEAASPETQVETSDEIVEDPVQALEGDGNEEKNDPSADYGIDTRDHDWNFSNQRSPCKELQRESNRTKMKRYNKRFVSPAQKSIKVEYETYLPESTARIVGNMETASVMGIRQNQRQEKPLAWEIKDDLSALDPHRGTNKSMYMRDKERLADQMRTVRKYYQEEYQKAIEKRKNRLARDYAIAADLKTERLVKHRIKAYFNQKEHEKRHEIQRAITKAKVNGLTKRRLAFEEFQEKQRTYQIEFLRQESATHWVTPETLHEGLFLDENQLTLTGIYPRGGSGLQTNFLHRGIFEAVEERRAEPEAEE